MAREVVPPAESATTTNRARVVWVRTKEDPRFEVDPGAAALAELRRDAQERCYPAASVNFTVEAAG